MTEATIQSFTERSADNPAVTDVGDSTYIVNNDYFSGKIEISRSFSTHEASPKDLVDQEFQMRHNPRKPEKYSAPQAEIDGFLLDPYDDISE